MNSNFSFLAEGFPVLEKMGSLSESYLYADANACIYKIGQMAEVMVKCIFDIDGLKPPKDDTQANRVNMLKTAGLSKDIYDIFTRIRLQRNKAVHEGYESFEECLVLIDLAYTLAVWFMQLYGDPAYEPAGFVMPDDIRNIDGYQKLLEENERLAVELEAAQAAALSAMAERPVSTSERGRRADWAAEKLMLSEKGARYLMDEQLRAAGWEADSVNLRYSKGTRPESGRNLAIAEWPTDTGLCKWGYAGYALFAGLKLVGVVEAKASRKDVASAIESQCREYSMGIKEEHDNYVIGSWGGYKAPFLFAANGRAYKQQDEAKSGVWFCDARDDANTPKALQGWMSPQGLLDMLERDIKDANRKLAESSYSLLRDADGLGLRPYQIEAIENAEAAVLEGRQAILLAMAAGTGKTRTALGMIYRFLKAGRFGRILYLVDRTELGEQVADVFKEVKIEGLMTLDDIYDIKMPGAKAIGRDANIHVATVQHLVKRIVYSDVESTLSVSDYDMVVVDEAYQSRSVVEYFDAVKIALTATPMPDTVEIFGDPVYEYPYMRAVLEGYLVDCDAPHVIIAEHEDGQGFNPAALEEIAMDLNPEGDGKTLVYAVDDSHADLIVKTLKEAYEPLGVSGEAVMKITGNASGENPYKATEAVRRFKNERYPSVAVTSDLLAAGIDVPEVTTLVFMRMVKSQILLEQMLGRAARLCPQIGKTHFEIYDLIGACESLAAVNTVKPVAQGTEAIIARIHRKGRSLSERELAHFSDLSNGLPPSDFARKLAGLEPQEVKECLLKNARLLEYLDRCGQPQSRPMAPKEYLDEFSAFVSENKNAIAELSMICERPQELTCEGLRSFKRELDRHGFTEKQLNEAWKELKNEDIAADIVSFVRNCAQGLPLESHEGRVKNAMEKLRSSSGFSKEELAWLARIEKTLLHESVVDREALDMGAYKTAGGFNRIDKVFSGGLEERLREVMVYLHNGEGETA
ncbi:MAG: DEAD/DEAH box helicase family protein [Clostridiales bacterium]|nr:DEAD/DEAH box helicase family protein [Clostridiales bacterium]